MAAHSSIQSYLQREERPERRCEVRDVNPIRRDFRELTRAAAQYERALHIVELSVVPEDEEPPCECVEVDVDEVDARSCPQHGPRSTMAHQCREREAADIAASYSELAPAADSLRAGFDPSAHHAPDKRRC